MNLFYIIISLELLLKNLILTQSINKPYITKLDTSCLMGGILTNDELINKIHSCKIHQDIKNQLIKNINNENDDSYRQDIDWKNKIIYIHYGKRIYLKDRWHQLFLFYSYSAHYQFERKEYVCKYIRYRQMCFYRTVKRKLRNEEIENLKNNALEKIKSKIQLLFSSSVDEIQKDKFYSVFPFFSN